MEIISNDIPNIFMLYNAYPNPFNPTTMIKYDIPEDTFVSVNIYDMIGRRVRTMLSKRISAGRKSIIWDGTNSFGQPVSAGTYFYTIKTDRYFETKKIILLK
jgi:flagellar hook assembly protein FlgD